MALNELEVPGAVTMTRPAPAQASGFGANPDFLFEMIVAELQWTSMQLAALCAMATVAAPAGSRWSLRSCRHIVHDDTGVMRLALRYSAEIGVSADLQRGLDEFYVELSDLQKRISPLIEADMLSIAQRDQLQRLLPLLRKLAAAAANELAKLEPIVRERLDANYLEDNLTIRRFAERAAKGDTADVDRFGVVSTPRLKQRRQSPRVAVGRRCRLKIAEGEFEAELVDVSREGLGVKSDAPVAERQPVVVLLDGGRRLEATVARRTGRQIGLLLRTRLSFTDPLFQDG
jgi:PilZ domain